MLSQMTLMSFLIQQGQIGIYGDPLNWTMTPSSNRKWALPFFLNTFWTTEPDNSTKQTPTPHLSTNWTLPPQLYTNWTLQPHLNTNSILLLPFMTNLTLPPDLDVNFTMTQKNWTLPQMNTNKTLSSNVDTDSTQTPQVNAYWTLPPGLNELCPYTSFCNTSAEKSPAGHVPCCKPCSCDWNCGLSGNCCHRDMDTFKIEETFQMVCRSPVSSKQKVKYRTHYRMIDKCLGFNSSGSQENCSNVNSEFRPVVSPQSGYIYVNNVCALCNKVFDAIPWRKSITCLSDYEDKLSLQAEVILKLNTVEYSDGCFLLFLPPKNIDVASELCEPDVVRECNVYGTVPERQPFWDYCYRFNASYTPRWALQLNVLTVYANVYCYLCNKFQSLNESKVDGICDLASDTDIDMTTTKFVQMFSLTTIIDFEDVGEQTFIVLQTGGENCNASVPILDKCRETVCPWGQIRINNKCDYYSKEWIGGPFTAWIRLTPVDNKTEIPLEFISALRKDSVNDNRAVWLQREALRNWEIFAHYAVSVSYDDSMANNSSQTTDNDNKPYGAVKYFVIKAQYPKLRVDPHYIQTAVTSATRETWTAQHKNYKFSFLSSLNEMFLFSAVRTETLDENRVKYANTGEKIAFLPFWAYGEIGNFQGYDLLFRINPIQSTDMVKEIVITKLFFCHQIVLLEDEFEDKVRSIFLYQVNKTLYEGSYIKTFKSADCEQCPAITVRVCQDQFETIVKSTGPDNSTGSAKALIIIMYLICLKIYVFYFSF